MPVRADPNSFIRSFHGSVSAVPTVWSAEPTKPRRQSLPLKRLHPAKALPTSPSALRIAYTPLREEDLLTRRMSVSCLPPALPQQINLRPDLGG